MLDGAARLDNTTLVRSERLRGFCRDLPTRMLLQLIESFGGEHATEIAEILLLPDLNGSLTFPLSSLVRLSHDDARHFAILAVLLAREPERVAPANMAYALGMPRGTLRSDLQSLERAGLVSRHRERRRRNQTRYMLTSEGRSSISRALVVFLSVLESYSHKLPATSLLVMKRLCDTVRNTACRHLLLQAETIGSMLDPSDEARNSRC